LIASLKWTYSRFCPTFFAWSSTARTMALSAASRNPAGGTSWLKFLSAKVRARWTKLPYTARSSLLFRCAKSSHSKSESFVSGIVAIE